MNHDLNNLVVIKNNKIIKGATIHDKKRREKFILNNIKAGRVVVPFAHLLLHFGRKI